MRKTIKITLDNDDVVEVLAYFPAPNSALAVHRAILSGNRFDNKWTITHVATSRRVCPGANKTKRARALEICRLLQPDHEAWRGDDTKIIMKNAEPLWRAVSTPPMCAAD